METPLTRRNCFNTHVDAIQENKKKSENYGDDLDPDHWLEPNLQMRAQLLDSDTLGSVLRAVERDLKSFQFWTEHPSETPMPDALALLHSEVTGKLSLALAEFPQFYLKGSAVPLSHEEPFSKVLASVDQKSLSKELCFELGHKAPKVPVVVACFPHGADPKSSDPAIELAFEYHIQTATVDALFRDVSKHYGRRFAAFVRVADGTLKELSRYDTGLRRSTMSLAAAGITPGARLAVVADNPDKVCMPAVPTIVNSQWEL